MWWGTEDWVLIFIGGLSVLVSSVLYMLGGTSGFTKSLRRYGSSFILSASSNFLAVIKQEWVWQYLMIFPVLVVGFSLPYGSDTVMGKLFKRTMFAIACVSAGIFGLWAKGFIISGWGILIMQGCIGVWSVYLGIKNPYGNAPLEQFVICILLTLTIPFWVFIR